MKEQEIREGDIVEIDYIDELTEERVSEGKALVMWKGFNHQPLIHKLDAKRTIWSGYDSIARVVGHVDIERYMEDAIALEQEPCEDCISRQAVLNLIEELKRDHETTEFVLYAHTVNDVVKKIIKFDDKETAQTCLMSELKRAKQTDGIARFDGDITAHETQSVKEHKSKWIVRKPMTEGGEYEVQCEKCGHTVGLLVGAKSYEEALERFKEWLEVDEGITFTKHCSSCGARMEGDK